MLRLEAALQIVLGQAEPLGTEVIELEHALGRVLASAVYADRNYPPFNRAAMDGFAIRSQDWNAGLRSFLIAGELMAGNVPPHIASPQGTALKIMTGAVTPDAYDAVVKIEDCEITGQHVAFKSKDVKPYQNIAREGEDLVNAQQVLEAGQEITLGTITALASVGASALEVYTQPRVVIVTTGDEIVPIEAVPLPYQIRNSNATTLKGLLGKIGFVHVRHEHLADDPVAMPERLGTIMGSADVVLLTGGVSAGAADYVPKTLEQIGIKKLFHKVQIKPGKPAWFGTKQMGAPAVFALPGNPLSVLTTFKLFVEPYLRKCCGKDPVNYQWRQVAVNRTQKVAMDEFFPYIVLNNTHGAMIEPLALNGSGDITATLYAAGIAQHPLEFKELKAGSSVKVFEL